MKFLLFFIVFAAQFGESKTQEKIIAQVNEKIILLSDLKTTKKNLKSSALNKHPLLEIFPKRLLLSKRNLLLDFIVADFLLEEAIKTKSLPLEEEVLNKFMQGSSKKFKNNKKMKNIMKASLEKTYFLQKTLFPKINVSNKEISHYYFMKNKKKLFDDQEFLFKFITFPNSTYGTEKAKRALQEMNSLSFKKVAKRLKKSIFQKKLRANEITPKMKEVLKLLAPSQTSSPFTLNNQIYILKLVSKNAVLSQKQQIIKMRIKKILEKKEWKNEMKLWLKKQKSLSLIKKYSI